MAAIVVAITMAWSNSLPAPFLLDDYESILANPTLRDLAAFDWLRPPSAIGETVSGRPLLNFTFALDHALHGIEVRGYRVTNILIHALAALALFGVVRRTLARRSAQTASVELAASAVALVWALHPLQTAAVTYVVQRAESLAALFLLLTLYGFVRATEAPPGSAAGRRWRIVSWVACLCGVATKETAAVAPVLVLLYDRAFLSGSFRAAWQMRARYYLSLGATWLLVAALVVSNRGRGGSAGFHAAIGAGEYFLTQCEAVVRYLALAFWPASQVFDYGVPVVSGFGAVWPQFLLLAALEAGTLWALWRNRATGFLGAAFFLLLAPSSSFVPIATQTIAEHRMYLPLAPLLVLAGGVLMKVGAKARFLFILFATAAIVALGVTTFVRNRVYLSELSLWQDTVNKRPDNPRAHHNLGLALLAAGDAPAAAAEFREAIRLRPEHAFAHFSLGTILFEQGDQRAAATHFEAALAADPHYVSARVNLARASEQLGRTDEAIGHYRTAALAAPGDAEIPFALGTLLAKQRRIGEAADAFASVLALDPNHTSARANLANCQLFEGRIDLAIENYEAVLRQRPDDTAVRRNLEIARELQQRSRR